MKAKTLEQVLIENHGLTTNGWRNWYTKPEDFKAWREETASDEFKEQFEAALALLETAIPIKTPSAHSYGLKHLLEIHAGRYISNGACIAAALALGLTIKRDQGSPNCLIGVSKRNVKHWSDTQHEARQRWSEIRRQRMACMN